MTVPFWEAYLLPEPAYSELEENLETIANAWFVVYDDAFYQARPHDPRPTHIATKCLPMY